MRIPAHRTPVTSRHPLAVVAGATALILAVVTATPSADNWPEWRGGPKRDGRSAETGLQFSPAGSAGANKIAVDEVDLGAALPEIGKVSPVAGDASVRYITRAVELAMSGEADVIVTAPINK